MIGESLASARKGVKFEEMPDNLVSNENSHEKLVPLKRARNEGSNSKNDKKKMASISEFSDRASKKQATVDPEQMFEGGDTEQGQPDLEGKSADPDSLHLGQSRRRIKNSGKKLFVSRLLGSAAFLILWGLLLLLSLVLTYNSKYQTFQFCLELTLVCMGVVQLGVDPVLYFVASKFMVRRHQALKGDKEALSTSSLVYFTLSTDQKYGGYRFF